MATLRLDGVVGWDIMAADVAGFLANNEGKNVSIVMNSGGGDIIEGFSIINAMKDFTGKIHAKIDFAGSMMSAIAMFADTRMMRSDSSIMMTHRPWGGAGGHSEDLRRHADTLDKMEVMIKSHYSIVTGMSESEVDDYLAVERYLTADEAKDYKLIDKVEGGKADLAAVAMMAAMTGVHADFDGKKLVAKIESMKSSKKPVRNLFNGCETLAMVESVMRAELKLSQNEATAIVAAVRKSDHGDRDQETTVNMLQNFNFSNI